MTAAQPLDLDALERLCLPPGKPFIGMKANSVALETALLTPLERRQIAAAWNALPDLIAALRAAEAKIEKVRALHQRISVGLTPECRVCGPLPYPCATVRALDDD